MKTQAAPVIKTRASGNAKGKGKRRKGADPLAFGRRNMTHVFLYAEERLMRAIDPDGGMGWPGFLGWGERSADASIHLGIHEAISKFVFSWAAARSRRCILAFSILRLRKPAECRSDSLRA